ncbi:hypothetical protein [Nocardioides sp.]|uniref:hypothetical protein n=1 Tax=Nocardioides sp. TaxID=35761 RepID=UPI003517FC1E
MRRSPRPSLPGARRRGRRRPLITAGGLLAVACLLAPAAAGLGLAAPVAAEPGATGPTAAPAARVGLGADPTDVALLGERINHLAVRPGQLAISGCFLASAPLFVTSGVDSLRVYDVADPAAPRLVGVLPEVLFENEAMTCGERRTASGVRRFVLVGVDLVQAAPTDPSGPTHVNVGGGELIVVDVTTPSRPRIAGRTEATTSTHTVACIDVRDCRYAYSAGEDEQDPHFSIVDLTSLERPREVDAAPRRPGTQPFTSPTAGHQWNIDAAGVATHTGWGGASMWDVSDPRRPRLLATTGRAGRGEDPRHPGWNDFILHNAFRPHADRFEPNRPPSLTSGNVLLVTEEDYEQTDCARAGSFQTWWVKRLGGPGAPGRIVPLDKVELADLGTYPLPRGAFCSSHWFDYRPGGLVAAGFYGGGTQILDVRDPRRIRSYSHAVWGASEVWDAMWVPVYRDGRRTSARTNVVYSLDLVRGLDVYAVDVPGDGRGALPPPARGGPVGPGDAAGAGTLVLAAGAAAFGLTLLRRRRPVRGGSEIRVPAPAASA